MVGRDTELITINDATADTDMGHLASEDCAATMQAHLVGAGMDLMAGHAPVLQGRRPSSDEVDVAIRAQGEFDPGWFAPGFLATTTTQLCCGFPLKCAEHRVGTV
jgi:hypothetical protein